MPGSSDYQKLISYLKSGSLLASIGALLDWDQETKMPSLAIKIRSEQLALISSLSHKEHTSKRYAKLLSKLIDIETGELFAADLTPKQIACVKRLRTDYLKEVKLPSSFVKKFAELTSEASQVWATAKRHSSFKDFAPYLTKIVDLCKKKADYLGYHTHPYNALLNLYEPEMTEGELTALFTRLKIPLAALLKSIAVKETPRAPFFDTTYPLDKQMEIGNKLLQFMGFDQTNSRLDISNHPFCSAIHSHDIRMTTRLHPDNVVSNVSTVLHEGGHGLYALYRPAEEWGNPLGDSCSLGIDESQSRLWETIIGKSYPFWQYFFPILQEQFPEQLSQVDLDTFYKAINQVKPSFIRVESDEVCYCLHVILRFDLEKALIEGSLKVKDLPDAWNDKMVDLLGIHPKNDAEGCLQDIHWSMGGIGYFPTYALGNIYAAQFFKKFESTHPSWSQDLAKGKADSLVKYLKNHIHQHGRRYSPEELLRNATDEELSEKPYLEYLTNKYSKIYSL